ncbi:MAG: FtsW/RodA/SpoVE family cell cycle protein [Clostridia bacterium]|nr:FtsW/RodA/SpoVE family cell cycle protein [Clostridia bacterium]MBO7318949.1 FtsW/RodA/SpoVE family cell cycle protein [Clostridia bacterium]
MNLQNIKKLIKQINIKDVVLKTDILFLVICLALSVFGIIMVSSATYSGETLFSRDAKVMVLATCMGLVAAMVISFIDYDIILKLWPLVGLACVLMMLGLFPFGVSPEGRSDAFSWYKIGSLYFQPSELVKIGFIITFAFHLSKVKNNVSTLKNVFFLCVHAAIPILLVVVTGDMGSALIFILMFIGMMFAAGVHWLYFPAGALAVVAASPVIWLKVFDDIQRNRILALFNPDAYPTEIYQQNQARKAIINGGFSGMGLFEGELSHSTLLPERQNDMIFSVVCEETGFIGAFILILLFALLAIRIVIVGRRSGNFAAEMMCYGVAFMILFQAIINIGMCTRLLPVIGITLPFISAGGTSVICLYLAIGLILSIYRSSSGIAYEDFRYARMARSYN